MTNLVNMFLTSGLVLDEGIEVDENVEGSDKLEDDSFLHDTAEGKHESDSEHHEYEGDDSQMFEADSDIPLLQEVSSVIVTYRTALTVLGIPCDYGMVHSQFVCKGDKLEKG
jgi:hypothetical protein